MRYGIPGFRTPRDVLDAEIQRILDLGVKPRTEDCRIGTDVTMEQIREEFDAVFLGLGAQAGRRCRCRAPKRRTASPPPPSCRPSTTAACTTSASAWWSSAAATPRSTSPRWRAVSAISTKTTHERPSGSASSPATRRTTSPTISAAQGAEVVLIVDRSPSTRCRPTSTRSSRPRPKASHIRGGMTPVGVVLDADGRATALRVVRCEAKMVGGKLEIKPIAGTEEDITGRPDRLRHRPGGRLHRPGGIQQRQGRDQRRQELPGARASPASSSAATSCVRTC